MLNLKLLFLQMIVLFSCGVRVYCDCNSSHELELRQLHYKVTNDQILFGYACTATGCQGDFLSWYQIPVKEPNHSILLKRVQRTDSLKGLMVVTVDKTLQGSDNGSHIYCAKQREFPGGEMSNEITSNLVPITFRNRYIKPVEKPYVIVKPNTRSVVFNVNETLTFVCSGSRPMDGRKLTWYIQGQDSDPVYAENQMFDSAANTNNLTLQLNDSYNLKHLFCAQNHHLYTILPGGFGHKPYGELARSKTIKLNLRIYTGNTDEESSEEEYGNEEDGNEHELEVNGESHMDRQGGPGNTSWLPVEVTIAVVVVVVLAVSLWLWLHRRRSATPTPVLEPNKDEAEDDTYATTVSYVELDLQQATGGDAATQVQESPYTQIIGIYKQS